MKLLNTLGLGLIAMALVGASPSALAIANSGKIPILLYHLRDNQTCDYDNGLIALATDLNTLNHSDHGFTVVPLYWVAEWVAGVRDGSTLPAKPIAITFDDGPDADYVSFTNCGSSTSGYQVLSNFKTANPGLPWYSPHASSFVIASQIARGNIGADLSDYWWYSAQNSGLIEIYNHSVDHDHPTITYQQWDPFISTYIAAGGYGDGTWAGTNNFARIDSYTEADIQIRKAASYIYGKIGVWPDLFAYPNGQASSYMTGTYFPNYGSEHNTFAAFCLGDTYATRSSNRWCIPRFTHKSGWTDTDSFKGILNGAP